MTDDEKKASANRSDIAVAASTLGAAGAAAVMGFPAEVGTILSASGVLLTASKGLHNSDLLHRVQDWLGTVPALHVARIFHRVNERIEQEHIEVDPVNMIDLLREASQFVGGAATEEKRKMMEEVIINGARRSKDAAARIEAVEILSAISEMPDASALIFAAVITEWKKLSPEESQVLSMPLPDCGLHDRLSGDAQKYLGGDFHMASGRFPFPIEDRPGVIESVDNNGEGIIFQYRDIGKYRLTEYGKWLAEWITNNPAPRPEAEEASPTA